MTSSLFRSLGTKVLGAAAISTSLLIAACGTTSATASGTATATTVTKCTVAAADLKPAGGTVITSAPAATITGSKTAVGGGSSALGNLMKDAVNAFNAGNSGATISYNVTSSGAGLGALNTLQFAGSDVYEGQVNATYSGRDTDHQIAVAPFTLVVSKDISSTVTDLTTKNIQDIYAGTITNWSQLGGPSEPITVVVRSKGSGTRITFDNYVLGSATASDEPAGAQTAASTGNLITDLTGTAGAIGYTQTSFVLDATQSTQLFPICIDHYGATQTAINAGNYKFWNYEHIYTPGTTDVAADSAAGAFLAYLNSTPFQTQNLAAEGFFQISSLTSAAKATHPKPANA